MMVPILNLLQMELQFSDISTEPTTDEKDKEENWQKTRKSRSHERKRGVN